MMKLQETALGHLRLGVFLTFCAIATACSIPATAGESESGKSFVAQVSLANLRDTELGQRLMKLVHHMAQEEAGTEDVVAKVTEALGFDPLQEIRTITVMSEQIDSPQDSMSMIVGLGDTTGNLEGLMLTLPGYDSEEDGERTIHSADMDGKRLFVTIYISDSGDHHVLAAVSRNELMDLLASAKSGSLEKKLPSLNQRGSLLRLKFDELPSEIRKDLERDNPMSNVVKLVSNFELDVREVRHRFEVTGVITASSEKKAAQIQQLAQGAMALVGIMEEQKKNDAEFMALLEILEEIEMSRDGAVFTLSTSIPEELVMEFLRKEADLPL